jgi:hypothetical protein
MVATQASLRLKSSVGDVHGFQAYIQLRTNTGYLTQNPTRARLLAL